MAARITRTLSRLGVVLDPFRPEYVDAVNAAATWNPWFFLALVLPPALLTPIVWYRVHRAVNTFAFICATVLCLYCFGLGVQYIWDVKEIHAQTDAELADVTADTAKLYAPVIFGIPYAILYTALAQLVALLIEMTGSMLQGAKRYFRHKPVSKNAR